MRYVLAAASLPITIFLAGSLLMPRQQSRGVDPSGELPEVRVALLGSGSPVARIPKVADPDQALVGSIAYYQPHRMILRFPDGETIDLASLRSELVRLDGVLISVYMNRPLKPVRFEVAVADLRSTLERLRLEPDGRTEQVLEGLEAQPRRPDDPFLGGNLIPPREGSRFVVSDSVSLAFEFYATPRGWYYKIVASALREPSRIAEATLRLITIPSVASPAGKPTRDVSIRLVGPIEEIKGMDLPPTRAKVFFCPQLLLEPDRLSLSLPGLDGFTLDARGLAMFSHYGLVEVVIARPTAESDSFEDARAAVNRAIQALGDDAAGKFAEPIAAWPEAPPETDEFGEQPILKAQADLSEVVNLEAQVRRNHEGAWSPILIFRASDAARKAHARQPDRYSPADDKVRYPANPPAPANVNPNDPPKSDPGS